MASALMCVLAPACVLVNGAETRLVTSPAPTPGAPSRTLDLTLVTWNVHDLYVASRDRAQRMALISRRIAALEADVVSLQEAFVEADRATLLRALEGTPYQHHAYFDYGRVGSGLFVLSAHPIVETDFHAFTRKGKWYKVWHGDWWAGKGVALTRIQHPGGAFDLYSTHAHAAYGATEIPDEYFDVRMAQLRELVAFVDATSVSGRPTFALGDFNCPPGSAEYAVVARDGGFDRMLTVETRFDHVFSKQDACLAFEAEPTERLATARTDAGETIRLSDHDGLISRIRVERLDCADEAPARAPSR